MTGLGVGIAAGLFNGLCVALLRFQPIVTTFATGIIFAGLALWVLPQAGKQVPAVVWQTYGGDILGMRTVVRSEEHTSELQSLMRNSYAVFCLKKKKTDKNKQTKLK